jgi:hypothetical protein
MMEARLKQLEYALNQNTGVFSESIFLLEAQNEVLRRALQDVYEGNPLVVASGTLGRIDFNAYLKHYVAELQAKEARSEEETGPRAVLVDSSCDADGPIIFGG